MDDSHSTGALLNGARGVGKTRLASEVLSRCDRMAARWTAATPAVGPLPRSVPRNWAPGTGWRNPTDVTERVIARLGGAAAPGSVVVVVDG